MGYVYLIHFERPLHHAQHYLGYTDNLEERLNRHRAGNGAKLMAAITRAGIAWDIARVWSDVDRSFERKLKNRKKSWELCPLCRAKRLKENKKDETKEDPHTIGDSNLQGLSPKALVAL